MTCKRLSYRQQVTLYSPDLSHRSVRRFSQSGYHSDTGAPTSDHLRVLFSSPPSLTFLFCRSRSRFSISLSLFAYYTALSPHDRALKCAPKSSILCGRGGDKARTATKGAQDLYELILKGECSSGTFSHICDTIW